MRIKMTVKAKASWSTFHRDVAKSAVEYAIDEYGLECSTRSIVVKLIGCADEHEGAMVKMTKDSFIIWVASQPTVRKLLYIVFHEMTHVKQAVFDGWEQHDTENLATWKGKVVPYDVDDDKDYWNAPWEVEARAMGKELRKTYIRKMR